ncbi:MAG TPA: hypothetical protein ENN22_11710 [bacterium]|nr:hypothetical protein [bacterium]
MWWKIILILILFLIIALLVIHIWGNRRWKAETQTIRQNLQAAQRPMPATYFDPADIADLPPIVRRYFNTVLKKGQPMITRVQVVHRGTFNMGETKDNWKPFRSDQVVITRRPGFDWNGMVQMAPGLPVHVHDAYVAGEGILHAALFGLFTVMHLRDTTDIAKGELMRFFAEAAWYPTALLPGQGIQWEAIDDHSAKATLTDGSIALTMTFGFNEQGLIETVWAEDRARSVGDQIVPTPWQGRFWNYQERGGMLVPLDGEVAWLLHEGEKPYWRGHIEHIDYEFARE